MNISLKRLAIFGNGYQSQSSCKFGNGYQSWANQIYVAMDCSWEGLDLDLRVRPPTPQHANANLRIEFPRFRDQALDIRGQKFQGLGLNLKAFILTVRDLASHLCQMNNESGTLR